jgi:hypothetical protein
MPERHKLAVEVFSKVMSAAPDESWVVARISNGEIVAVGPTSMHALHYAMKKRPDLERGEVALLWKHQSEKIA